MVSNAVALHEIGHDRGHAHCGHADGAADHGHGAAGGTAHPGDGETGLSGALHELAHSGHCCAPGSAVPADSLVSVGHRARFVMPTGPTRAYHPQAPTLLFRPPIAA